jgi:hypothetical protein
MADTIPEPPFGGLPTGAPGGGGGLGGVLGSIGGAVGGGGSATSGLFGSGSVIRQILVWQVLGEILQPLLAPLQQEIANVLWTRFPDVPLSPAEAALGVVKNTIPHADAVADANRSGISGTNFDRMVANTGEPISIEQALFLLRRGKIDQARLVHAIRQSRVRDEWTDAILDLEYLPISASDAVDAAVEEQIPYADAERMAGYNGVTPDDFRILYNTRGRPPGPAELLELVRRGIIPRDGTGPDVLSLQQGIAESAVKTKWTPAYNALLTYLPPPRTVTALERQGAITPEQAQQLYIQHGLSPELAAAYSADASRQKTQKHRDLTEAQVLSMYQAHFLTSSQASGLLEVLGYTAQETATLLAWEDVQRELKAINTALSRLHTLYTSRKIGTTTLHNAFNALGVSPQQIDELLRIWTLERDARVATLTAAQIATAFQHAIIDQPTAVQALEDLGYSAFDAWLYLSQHMHTALPDQPAPDSSVTGQLP